MPADGLDAAQKLEVLKTFFTANPTRMIVPFSRYRELYRKQTSALSEPGTLVGLFSSQEIRDLQVWSNLAWTDPMFRVEEPVKSLFAKGRHYSEEDKTALLDWQLELMQRVVPTYQKLQSENRLEVSFTPYYHPILPLLCDTEIATEALPSIVLPEQRFQHSEDAERQMAMAAAKYRTLFGRDMEGMWPSEGSVSEEVMALAARQKIGWLATDEEILTHSLTKSGLKHKDHPIHRVYEHSTGVKVLFRDHALSDRIGFVYSAWDAPKAVADFLGHIKRLRSLYEGQLDQAVIPIILDGENAWEYFPDDATEFLDLFYRGLSEDKEIETVTLGEAAATLPATHLPQIFAGSWINHNFRIWIGHSEDNAAWDLLSRTRDDLVAFEKEQPEADAKVLKRAWNRILIAEGSDWCWWYGDEHRSEHNEQFDIIFRQHLAAVYELMGSEIPLELLRPIYQRDSARLAVMPDAVLTPEIDGYLTHFYEWAGAGFYDCSLAGGAMHQVTRRVSGIYFAFDRECFHIRLDFHSKKELEFAAGLKAVFTLYTPESSAFEIDLSQGPGEKNGRRWAVGNIVECSIPRERIWPDGFGDLSLSVALTEDDQLVETWPEHGPIRVSVPKRHEEMFWPT
jgi:alpha-amylase/alpha-mannosidase (GH57 family)